MVSWVRSSKSEIRRQRSDPPHPVSFDRLRVIGPPTLRVALLTGGGDKPYALGLAGALTSEGVSVDFIGSDDLNVPEVVNNPRVNFLNLRGRSTLGSKFNGESYRVLGYYCRLIRYAATAKPKIFHLLWNNKFELFDRTVLMLYYRLLGKQVVFTAHNVNAGKRRLERFMAKSAYIQDSI